ncbi:Asp23/Gls24 family envelope stress response protein [Collinsella sp. An307]|uniref:Asp23/Gls24 family envelope stress response protein n=1 Tax=Collinsella sp. An307 TaxID=1965630 RepID=UPI000B3A0521|nr:Asp23/Gls24 family envelope stress response protein [Collinsella sp. An307]OUO20755.1 Asp23/Gls24 family envelope stress response protein [Collinsella sp. An307]
MAQDKELRESIEVADEVAAAEDEAMVEANEAAEETVEDVAEAVDADEADADDADDEDYEDDEDDEYEETEDSLTYSNGVIEKIVAMATREVPHVLGMKGNLIHFVQETLGAKDLTKGVTVEVTDDNRVIVNISVIIEYGCYAPAIFEDVKARVTERLTEMTGLDVAGINLRIEDVVTLEAYNESKKKYVDSQKAEAAE